jgi:hypothetical protein
MIHERLMKNLAVEGWKKVPKIKEIDCSHKKSRMHLFNGWIGNKSFRCRK